MKTFSYLSFAALLLLFSCSKTISVDPVTDFDVTATAATYKAGDPVLFTISGSPHNISFYSGETGNDYTYKDGRSIPLSEGDIRLSFTSSVQVGTQANQLSLLVSTDFGGDYTDLEKVRSATWTDISSRFQFGTSATFLSSTEQSIADLIQPGKPIYFAFRYLTKPQAANGLVRTWMIQSFDVKSSVLFNNVAVSLANQLSAGFRLIDEDPVNTPSRSLLTSTRVTLRGNVYKDPADPIYDPENPIYDPANPIYNPESELYNPNAVRPEYVPYDDASPFNDPTRENWAVSTPVYVEKVDLGPDQAVPVKGLTSGKLPTYSHTYNVPGTYKACFVASNNSINGSQEIIREIMIKITK